jgi:hypothetical protein
LVQKNSSEEIHGVLEQIRLRYAGFNPSQSIPFEPIEQEGTCAF